eukprot:TRINITY_DN5611_c1_g1_i1.p2 TRINITY_DN5611_c1_g1~~TRINITY_DN5611_c1_g1_i1.p2  ORF type:complete len:202 (-),score=43.42 TRINITY_DN5611_c1_g1_i1:232-837(-)
MCIRDRYQRRVHGEEEYKMIYGKLNAASKIISTLESQLIFSEAGKMRSYIEEIKLTPDKLPEMPEDELSPRELSFPEKHEISCNSFSKVEKEMFESNAVGQEAPLQIIGGIGQLSLKIQPQLQEQEFKELLFQCLSLFPHLNFFCDDMPKTEQIRNLISAISEIQMKNSHLEEKLQKRNQRNSQLCFTKATKNSGASLSGL